MITLPLELAALRQFCCRNDKQPIIKKPSTGKLTSSWKGNKKEGWEGPEGYLTLSEAQAYVAEGATYWEQVGEEWVAKPVNGIGFICCKEDDPAKQIVGGDLDACRDPETGKLGQWATEFLKQVEPFYIEVSPSLCGVRFFCRGHLPNRVDKLAGNGPDDIPEETKARILVAKPTLKKKIETGESNWNGIELYEAKRHLTITGIDQLVFPAEDRTGAIMAAVVPIVASRRTPGTPLAAWAEQMAIDAAGKRLPKLDIEAVIRAAGFVEFDQAGDQIRGSVPMLASSTGCNIVINPVEGSYCWMHNNINQGGDAWVWLAHECGAAPWEAPGKDLLRDPAIRSKTVEYAISKGLIKREDLPYQPGITSRLKLVDVAICIGDGEEKRWKFSPTTASSAILQNMTLAMSKTCDKIFYFDGDIYIPDGERIVNNVLVEAGGDLATIKNKKEVNAILHDTLLNFPVTFDPDPYLLGVENGVVDLRTGEFRVYRAEDLITDKIKVEYDKDATCPLFTQFIKEIAPNETDQAMMIDWFAIHAIKLMFPYVMFLNGLGRNGKGVYERILKRFYGEEAFSNMPLEELNVKNNRFAGVGLFGKRGQIVAEAGEDNTTGKRTIPTNYLKNATGDGIIDTDQKNKGRIQFKPFYKATIDSNDMPRITDTSKGWIERFCKADLPYQYVDDPDPINHPMERKKDPKLFDKLTTKEELSGILNLIIECTIRISKTMTITRRSGEEMFAEYNQQSNSVATFLEKFCDFNVIGSGQKDIFFDSVYSAYENWCNMLVCDKVDTRRFGAAVKKFCGGREAERVHFIDGDGNNLKKRIYRGLTFDANRYQALSDHYRTIKGPLKTITGPLGPLNKHITCTRENSVENIGEQQFAQKTVNGPDIDCENSTGADSDLMGLSEKRMGLIAIDDKSEDKSISVYTDTVTVTFLTDYSTDMGGSMMTYKEGDKATVARSRADAWQKRGIVIMEGGE